MTGVQTCALQISEQCNHYGGKFEFIDLYGFTVGSFQHTVIIRYFSVKINYFVPRTKIFTLFSQTFPTTLEKNCIRRYNENHKVDGKTDKKSKKALLHYKPYFHKGKGF